MPYFYDNKYLSLFCASSAPAIAFASPPAFIPSCEACPFAEQSQRQKHFQSKICSRHACKTCLSSVSYRSMGYMGHLSCAIWTCLTIPRFSQFTSIICYNHAHTYIAPGRGCRAICHQDVQPTGVGCGNGVPYLAVQGRVLMETDLSYLSSSVIIELLPVIIWR